MKFSISIFYFFVLVLCNVAMPKQAVACGGNCCKKEQTSTTITKTTKSDCKTQKSCCSKKNKKNKGCNGKCGGKSCPCPSSSSSAPSALMTSFVFPTFQADYSFFLSNSTGFYYLNIIPKPVYLSFWQPPKISSPFIG